MVNWVSHFTSVGYMPINISGRGKSEVESELLQWISMLLPTQGFIYTLAAPKGRTPSRLGLEPGLGCCL